MLRRKQKIYFVGVVFFLFSLSIKLKHESDYANKKIFTVSMLYRHAEWEETQSWWWQCLPTKQDDKKDSFKAQIVNQLLLPKSACLKMSVGLAFAMLTIFL
ncbi:hypothetical protein T4D_13733 [Trichinella pseudospiralis]|uniref:Uncharacterized protein n=1 Tax=Trichinella pseudospiralis TaxID=6337 RepID=A0A0V1FGK5_TRIPS|nr:hypothetical protein T4D_13733 [Trichinella pseudospiralis]